MPEIYNALTSLRLWFSGECALGNLFTDAMRWASNADIAFIQSGGIRGSGWPAGPVRISHLWEALPFANSLCTGIMSGLSLVRAFEYATHIASFESTWSRFGDHLLQVSGMRYSYNTHIQNGTRLVGLDIWNNKEQVSRRLSGSSYTNLLRAVGCALALIHFQVFSGRSSMSKEKALGWFQIL